MKGKVDHVLPRLKTYCTSHSRVEDKGARPPGTHYLPSSRTLHSSPTGALTVLKQARCSRLPRLCTGCALVWSSPPPATWLLSYLQTLVQMLPSHRGRPWPHPFKCPRPPSCSALFSVAFATSHPRSDVGQLWSAGHIQPVSWCLDSLRAKSGFYRLKGYRTKRLQERPSGRQSPQTCLSGPSQGRCASRWHRRLVTVRGPPARKLPPRGPLCHRCSDSTSDSACSEKVLINYLWDEAAASVSSSVKWGWKTAVGRGCHGSETEGVRNTGKDKPPYLGEKLHRSSKGLQSINAPEEVAIAQNSIRWVAWRGRGQKSRQGHPAWHRHVPPLHPTLPTTGCPRGLQCCPRGPGPPDTRLARLHVLLGSLLPHLIQGLQCHLQTDVLQRGLGPATGHHSPP